MGCPQSTTRNVKEVEHASFAKTQENRNTVEIGNAAETETTNIENDMTTNIENKHTYSEEQGLGTKKRGIKTENKKNTTGTKADSSVSPKSDDEAHHQHITMTKDVSGQTSIISAELNEQNDQAKANKGTEKSQMNSQHQWKEKYNGIKTKYNNMKLSLHDKEQQFKEIEKQLMGKDDEITELKKIKFDIIETNIKEKDKQLQHLKGEVQNENRVIKELKKKVEELEEEVKQTHERYNKMCSRKRESTERMINNLKSQAIQLEEEKNELQKKLTNVETEKKTKIEILNQKMMDEVKKKDLLLAEKSNDMIVVQKEKADLLLRLSEMAGRRLTDNNPNIADLSDQNRPTKLAEKYTELYDNEWTDAFQYLQTIEAFKHSEKLVIDTLVAIIAEAFTIAADTAKKQLDTFRQLLQEFFGNTSHTSSLEQDFIKQLKDQRKKATQPSEKLIKEFKHKLTTKIRDISFESLDSDALRPFLQKSLELCWLMAVQDPPLYLMLDSCKTGMTFDRNIFKEYTKTGKFIDFLVWPAVFLNKDGPLLCKGVVQCKKSNSFRMESDKVVKEYSRKAKSLYAKRTAPLSSYFDYEKVESNSSMVNTGQVNVQPRDTKL